jgi:hypothetical protein
MSRLKMKATEGMVLTNGEVFGRQIFLGTGDNPDNWHEIPEAEYEALMEDKKARVQFVLYGVRREGSA